ncbi:hypothetical protein ACNO5E_23035, partial [Vibrio parahaemolyticus]
MSKTTNQLVEILASGGSIKIDVEKIPFANLVKLAEASSLSKGTVIMESASKKPTSQLIELSK